MHQDDRQPPLPQPSSRHIAQPSGPPSPRPRAQAGAQRGHRPGPEPSPQPNPFALNATTHSYLARAAESLAEAVGATDVPARYASAHVAALRAAAALLAARAHPAPQRRRPQKNAWVLLAEVAPELQEWAEFFAAGAAKRAAAEAGSTRAVTDREADDLVRDADRFLAVVERALGLVAHVPVDSRAAALRPAIAHAG